MLELLYSSQSRTKKKEQGRLKALRSSGLGEMPKTLILTELEERVLSCIPAVSVTGIKTGVDTNRSFSKFLGVANEDEVEGNMTDIYGAISEEERNTFKTVYKQEGPKGLKDVILRNKDKWKSMPLKIAVTGNSGVGKSSFINSFCGLSAKDKGAAKVGVTETTTEIKSYPLHGNDKFVLFDIPGVGSPKFPKATYLKDIGFEKFDFFIIVTACRLTENDAWLGKKVTESKKKCFYVRTKIDTDILNEKHDRGDDFNETATIERIRQDARKCLEEATIVAHVYLITTRMKEKFDYPKLQDTVIGSAMNLKRQALFVFLQSLLESVVTENIERWKSKVGRMAIVSAIGGAIPLPGVSIGVDAAAILSKASHYRKKLFLDEDSLKGVHDTYSINIDELKLACRKITFSEYSMPVEVVANTLGTVGKLVLPVLGSAVAGSMCHDEMKSILCKILDDLKGDSLQINSEIIERMI